MSTKPFNPMIIFFKYAGMKDFGCWEWQGKVCKVNGYARFNAGYKNYSAHRFSYLNFNGVIPEGYDVHHICNNRKCVNPQHLKAISPRDHVHISNNAASRNYRKDKCIYGHIFNKDNTYTKYENGKIIRRTCRICQRNRSAKYNTKNHDVILKKRRDRYRMRHS